MNVFTEYVVMPWYEIAKLKDGGFIVFHLNDSGDRRRPDFACATTEQLFEYLAQKLADATQK